MLKKKENIEIRFFMTPTSAKSMLAKFREEGRRFQPYAFTDYYFKSGEKVAKVRVWKSRHTPKIEIITVTRKKGVKRELKIPASSLHKAFSQLLAMGFKREKPVDTICKEKAWLITKKRKPTYAIEFIRGLGWTGEIEVPEKDKRKLGVYLQELKKYGAKEFSKKSLREFMKTRKMGSNKK